MHPHVPSDVDVFHFLALTTPDIVDDVKVLEVATDVVCEIDSMGWVAARCSPVCGMTLQGLHSCQTQTVEIPIDSILVHWSVALQGNPLKRGQLAILVSPRHHKGPGCARLGLHITVSRVAVAVTLVKFVDATF